LAGPQLGNPAALLRNDRRMNPPSAPLLEAWLRFTGAPGTPFTIPGHKQRAGTVWPELGRLLRGDVPLFGGLDTVKDAPAALVAAEELGASLWDADWCRYSTGGSTHANQAAALAVGAPGDRVLVARNAHRSTLLGIILAGLDPVWLPPDLDPRTGLPVGVAPPALAAAVAEHPDAVALFLTEPSYGGTVSDLPALIAVAHGAGVPVVVDQAWGAHFGFHPAYPPHALAVGADAMIISAHKTLPSYSQAAVVAARTERLDRSRLERGFDASATTSPAGAILASIDAARAVLADPLGTRLLDRLLLFVRGARERLRGEPAFAGAVLPEPIDFGPGRFDPAKLVILLAGTTLSGTDLEASLLAAGCPVEMADRDTLVPIVTMLDDASTVARLCELLVSAAADAPQIPPRAVTATAHVPLPLAALTPREAFFAAHETVAADAAVGRIAAEVIAPYPPGVPVLVPGEVITADALDALRAAATGGIRIAYAADPSLAGIQVVTGAG
jgi:arginine decarboxylase